MIRTTSNTKTPEKQAKPGCFRPGCTYKGRIKDDHKIDPAMGTAGFICAAAEYIQEKYSKELLNTENHRHFVNDMFSGFDTDQTMLRIGAMNMMLHGVEAPQITWLDSLSEDNIHRDCYSLIMANPPLSLAA